MKHYLKTADADWYRRRLNGALIIVLVAFLALGLRLFHLQVVQGEEYRRLSENNCIRLQDIDPPRGQILDRQRRLLVDNRPSFNLVMVPRDAKPVDATLARLAVGTGMDPEELTHVAGRASSAYRPVVLRTDIDRDLLAAVEARRYDLPGISVDVKALRRYVYGDSACHLIGYMGEISAQELAGGHYPGCRSGDFIGKFGIEKNCEHFLRGQPGGRQVEVDARGQVIRVLKSVDAIPGQDVVLTIDQRLQAVAEQCLGNIAGAVVAVDPNSGEVLAMASRPGFDPNAFVGGINRQQWQALVENPRRPMENKAIQATYPPASTYKIVTALAGLQEGVIDVRSEFFCPGQLRYGNRSYRCWKRWGHGNLNVVEAISQSCDVFFYHVGINLGVDRLARYARSCGLGSRTEVGLDQEDAGLIPTAAWKKGRFGVAWQGGENLSVAIGQGYNLVTPIQLAMMIAAVGNGGTLYRPQLVLAVESADGRVIQRMKPKIKGSLDVSAPNMGLVREGLWRVVQGDRGTARAIRLEGIDISGKTGTAQVFSRKGETDPKGEVADHLKDHAWFVAYAPSEAPQIAVAVIIEHGEHGSSVAAPVARAVIRAYLDPAGAAEEAAMVNPETDEAVQ